jgi:hypothetical protein
VGQLLPAKAEHIRELCERAVTAESDDELQEILSELRSELRDHLEDVRARAAEVREKIFRAA